MNNAIELIEGYATYITPEETDSLQIPEDELTAKSATPTTIGVSLIVHC
ncbi:hypothetical protein H1V43_26140 [Streptomyces sp. PSKA54]|uniref:Uncharacterized protein n=1 Tax=Streptomyces himalayensis subsp. aureolus TaxID=2758039 RepID=A0A7W2D4T8_9ACTN|nr:hypothetical protein [Streptomyces himalayensis]MBA4864769.1 hypothetical protein [Streptomyces himalayensis subsp. aureolus]